MPDESALNDRLQAMNGTSHARRVRELTAHSDLGERLRSVPPAATIRGLYFRSVTSVLAEAGRLDAYAELFPEKYSAVRFYPLADYLERLAVGGALLSSPPRIHEGLYEIGRSNASAFAESLLGRVMIQSRSSSPRARRNASRSRTSYGNGRLPC